jgi:predicted RNA-binding protein with RPS1 domain
LYVLLQNFPTLNLNIIVFIVGPFLQFTSDKNSTNNTIEIDEPGFLTLNCSIEGYPILSNELLHENQSIDLEIINVEFTNKISYTIKNLNRKQHRGNYYCKNKINLNQFESIHVSIFCKFYFPLKSLKLE